MTTNITLLLWILGCFMAVVQGDFLDPPLDHSLQSVSEGETRLPCRFKVDDGQVVIQVTWTMKKTDDSKEQNIAVHSNDGSTEFFLYTGRVRFISSEPLVDSSLIIKNTMESDEGKYNCHISTYPAGNFERTLSLIVWTVPISSLDAVALIEGQPFQSAASCRSVARPPPRLSWDTVLPGQSLNRSTGSASIYSQYSLHPLRSMNGKRLDCLVWHETLKTPRRISNNLVVHYPPDAEIKGYEKNWFAGLEGAALSCVSRGNPKPDSYTWHRNGKELPEGVTNEKNGSLKFNRPLALTDAGNYQCVAKNLVGEGTADVEIKVTEWPPPPPPILLMVIVGAVAGVLLLAMVVVIVLVTCHHKRKNKELERELSIRREEISTLSRQASFRRINSVSTDARGQIEENIPNRERGQSGQGTLGSSLSSLGEQGRIRDSYSTPVGGGGTDSLGRPVLHTHSRRGRESRAMREENRIRVESFVQYSTSDPLLHPPLSPCPMERSTEPRRPLNGSAIVPTEGSLRVRPRLGSRNTHSPVGYPIVNGYREEDEGGDDESGMSMRTSPLDRARPEEQDGENDSPLISDVEPGHNQHFQQNNGSLGPKTLPKPSQNPSRLYPPSSIIQKAQIV